MKFPYAAILVVVGLAEAAYFSETNSIKSNRLLLGGGLRQSGIGIAYQRKIHAHIHGEGSIGFFPVDGFQGSIGLCPIWREDKRFRPFLYTGLSYVGGFGPIEGKVSVNGSEPAETEFETYSGIFGNISAGFQFRLWKGLGLQYNLGWRQTLAGGDYKIFSTTNLDTAKRFLDGLTGSGISLGGRAFMEF